MSTPLQTEVIDDFMIAKEAFTHETLLLGHRLSSLSPDLYAFNERPTIHIAQRLSLQLPLQSLGPFRATSWLLPDHGWDGIGWAGKLWSY
ncbi:unnamed protein product [Clonostachys byssicola]|uniref:Uncharacterized protein n=1 Tax=Clonostachys byssicola TaxID=160290 RepID=A0A9N9UDJ0_9HYPO|nr:unnamed protein product [Clonostachys byssicola]